MLTQMQAIFGYNGVLILEFSLKWGIDFHSDLK